jgi:hypothetical protein
MTLENDFSWRTAESHLTKTAPCEQVCPRACHVSKYAPELAALLLLDRGETKP